MADGADRERNGYHQGTRDIVEVQARPASGTIRKARVSVVFGFLFVKREPPSLTL